MKLLFTFSAVFFLLSALGLIFFPQIMLGIVGITPTPELIFILRASGGGVSALIPGLWIARARPEVARAILPGILVYLVLSSLIDAFAFAQISLTMLLFLASRCGSSWQHSFSMIIETYPRLYNYIGYDVSRLI